MWRVGAMIGVLALPVWAEAPETSIRPRPRPQVATVAPAPDPELAAAAVDAALDAVAEAAPPPEAEVAPPAVRPRPRPAVPTETAVAEPAPEAAPSEEPRQRVGFLAGLFGAPRPRPERDAAAPRGNGICGNPALTGVALDDIGSRTNGCGVDDPVSISMVGGVQLSTPATMDCTTANALAQWVDQGLRPAFEGQQVVGLQVAGHYICRTRNNIRGARISEHGRGRAIDISAIILGDGTILTVANNWNRAMRAAYQAGCGIFGTTLGPGSDGYHEDHMHFDTASHRNGPYCR